MDLLDIALSRPNHCLPDFLRQKMEWFFGTSFADVRLHIDQTATKWGAKAFTVGSHVFISPEHYRPTTAQGQRILGHELTHVVQQRRQIVSGLESRRPILILGNEELEQEADDLGDLVASERLSPHRVAPSIRQIAPTHARLIQRIAGPPWVSSQMPAVVLNDATAVITVYSFGGAIGYHASIYLERVQDDKPYSYVIDLVSPPIQINIHNAQQLDQAGNLPVGLGVPAGQRQQSLQITGQQALATLAAARRYQAKVNSGHYSYLKAGGLIGRLGGEAGTHGVNCSDFVMKVLKEAGVHNYMRLLFSTPGGITGRRRL